MGVHKYTYVGPYLECKVEKVENDIGKECPECRTRIYSKFCQNCGVAPKKVTELEYPSLYDLLGEEEGDWSCGEDLFDPYKEEKCKGEVYACCNMGCCFEWDGDYDSKDLTPAALANAIKKFKVNHKEPIKRLKEHELVVSVEIKFCVSVYYY